MKRKRFTEEQIIGILKEAEAGIKTADLVRKAWDQPRDVLPVEGEVRGHGRLRRSAASTTSPGNARRSRSTPRCRGCGSHGCSSVESVIRHRSSAQGVELLHSVRCPAHQAAVNTPAAHKVSVGPVAVERPTAAWARRHGESVGHNGNRTERCDRGEELGDDASLEGPL